MDGLLSRLFPGALTRSLWVFHTNAGGCNGCDIEVLDALTPWFDVERLGMKLVGSPRHADVLLVCGPVTRPMRRPLRELYDAVPDPKIVVAIGACAVGGGPWFDTYNVVGGVDKVIPVDMYVPGCPARPEAILHGVAQLLALAGKKVGAVRETQPTAPELARVGRAPGSNGGAPREWEDDMDALQSILGNTELLHGLLPAHVKALAECGKDVRYEANEYVNRSGETADAFWLVRQGLLAISIQVPGRGEVTIDVMRAGDFVGFSWLCPPHLLHFDIHALTGVHAVRFDGRAVRARFDADALLGFEVTSRFARLVVSRIEAMSMQLLDLYGEHPIEQA